MRDALDAPAARPQPPLLDDMSAPNRGLHAPRHASRSSADAQGPRRRMRPSAATARRLSNLADVQDPRRVMECAQAERQLRFQHLVRHYLSQILHGCKSAYCQTPTCLSCTKRNPSKPHRPPTQLTARALAFYLASQDSPHRGLCPHELKIPPSSLEIEGTLDTGNQQTNYGADREYNLYPTVWKMAQRHRTANKGISSMGHAEAGSSEENNGPRLDQSTIDAVNKRHQAKKDMKSLGQNLYDSVTMIYSYSRQIPSPTSVLSSLRSLANATQHDTETRTPRSVPAPDLPESEAIIPNTGPLARANSRSATPNVNEAARIVRQHSQQNLRGHSSQHSKHTASEVLSNGQQIHKVPYHPPHTAVQGKGPKTIDTTIPEGATDSPRLSITKTGRKNFTIGGEISPSMEKRKAPVIESKRVEQTTQPSCPTTSVISAVPTLNCAILEELKEDVYPYRNDQTADLNFIVDYDTDRRFQPTKPFVNRSLFYILSDPEALLKSFHDDNHAFQSSPLPHLDSARLVHSFRDWNMRNGALIFDSLWIALEALFTPPPELNAQKNSRRPSSRKATATDDSLEQNSDSQGTKNPTTRYLSNLEAAHIVMVCIHALTSLVSVGWAHTWAQLRNLRSWGIVIPNAAPDMDAFAHPYLNLIDELEYEPAVRLADRLLRGIGARTCFEHILASLNGEEKRRHREEHSSTDDTLFGLIVEHLKVIEHTALASKRRMTSSHGTREDPGWTVTATFLEWLRTIIIKKWDSKSKINKWSSVGTAVLLLDKLHANARELNLRPNMFEMPFLNERLDTVEEPLKFLNWEAQPNSFHLLQYSNLFPKQHLVAYFRTVNFTSMMAQYDHTTRVHQMQRSLDMFLREPYWWVIKYRMKVTLSDYLVLDVSRENPLKDTLDQLWGHEKRMLLKPLKVKMGQQEGEVGLDHGGVTYEFFRVVLGEAFKPDNGMFTIDPQSRMTWFQPCTLEPDWKFEMLGMLFSLAVYNGITLPVTFPLCFYHFLLPADSPFRDREIEPETLDYIKDGWPSLAKAFQDLLSWSDGDVGDVMMREYAFSYEVFGQKFDHNMEYPFQHATPGSVDARGLSQTEPSLVTNENRERFVRDYIRYLTYLSVAPQLWAFLKGFLVCINPRSLHFFTPTTLRDLVEGRQHISIQELKSCVKYEDGYSATHHTIVDFWDIVESFSQENCRRLLEFVTASDRVPVTGYESLTFHIVRIGGESENLPTSSTCFGKLYLPEYANRETMKGKLELAIQNSQGFGVV